MQKRRFSITHLPQKTGVYYFRNAKGTAIYIGKAVNIKRCILSHLHSSYSQNALSETRSIDYTLCASDIEALILESRMIKKFHPKYNALLKDDKNFIFIVATKEPYPRIITSHQPRGYEGARIVGPFTDSRAVKKLLSFLRTSFPFRSCRVFPKKECFYYFINRCPAPCTQKITPAEYEKTVKQILAIFRGDKSIGSIKKDLTLNMKRAAKKHAYEKAAELRNRIMHLDSVLSHKNYLSDISEETHERSQHTLTKLFPSHKEIRRIEGYDISNIAGTNATASMIVFDKGKPEKSQYRIFHIRSSEGMPNDTQMLQEALARRLTHTEWPLPDLILIDGGKGQLSSAKKALASAHVGKKIAVAALAKKEEILFLSPQRSFRVSSLPLETSHLLTAARDEAHRFARKHHLKLRKASLSR
jgi:excinuclease ABC subunit C